MPEIVHIDVLSAEMGEDGETQVVFRVLPSRSPGPLLRRQSRGKTRKTQIVKTAIRQFHGRYVAQIQAVRPEANRAVLNLNGGEPAKVQHVAGGCVPSSTGLDIGNAASASVNFHCLILGCFRNGNASVIPRRQFKNHVVRTRILQRSRDF